MRPGASTLMMCPCVPCMAATQGELSPELSMLPTTNMPRGAACCQLQGLSSAAAVRSTTTKMHTAKFTEHGLTGVQGCSGALPGPQGPWRLL